MYSDFKQITNIYERVFSSAISSGTHLKISDLTHTHAFWSHLNQTLPLTKKD